MNFFKVLVLNQTFEPLHFCNAKRAIVLVLSGKAENVEFDSKIVRSPSFSMRLPVVIRLMKYIKKPYQKALPFSKKNVLKRDQFRCQYCGKNHSYLTIDHIVPKSRGGRTTWENVVVACQSCNLIKGDRSLSETDLQLLKEPERPTTYLAYRFFQIPPSNMYRKVWERYLSQNKTH
jgi:5-methylcytosine-specific restriction endonuclease McrA